MIELLAPIFIEGLKFLTQERKNQLEKKYFNVMSRLRRAENAKMPFYYDSEIDLANEELEDFMKAFAHLLKEQNETILS